VGHSPNVFPVYIKTITLYNRANTLKVDVEFVLKQFFTSNTSVSSLMSTREDFFDKLKVLVVVSSDDAVSLNIFSDREHLKNYLNSNNDNPLVSRGVYGVEEAILGNDRAVQEATESARMAQQYGELYGSDLLFRKTFTIPTANPAYLSIFAAPIIDLNDDDPTPHISPQDATLGKIASEMVIKKSELNLATNLFYLKSIQVTNAQGDVVTVAVEDDRIWTGEVHQNGLGEWYTGNGSNGGGYPLRVERITNSKIADQRNLARVERIEFNFNKLDSLTTTNKSIRDRLKALENIKKQKPSYLSPLYFAKNEDNDLSLYFGFDYLEAIVNGAKYQALCTNTADKLTSCEVISTKVIRRRVNKPNVFNRLTGGDSPLRIYDNKIEVIGTPTRRDYNTTTGVMQYVIKDEQMKDITTGLYEYGFEITIQDNSRDRLLNLLTSTSQQSPGIDLIVTQLEAFLTESLLPGNYNITTNQYTPVFRERIKSGTIYQGLYADLGGQQSFDYSLTSTSNLGAAAAEMITTGLETITDLGSTALGTFEEGASQEFGGGSVTVVQGPWLTGVAQYSSALNFFSVAPSQRDLTNLWVATSPLISGPAGIQYLIRLLKDFSSSLRSVIGVTKGGAAGCTWPQPASPTGLGKRVFTIRQYFLESANADQLHDYGLDFLNMPGTNTGTQKIFKEITFDHWKKLLDTQAGKDNGIIAEDATYLTPNFLRLPGKAPINLFNDDNQTKNQITTALYQILYANMHTNSPVVFGANTAIRPRSPQLAHTDVEVAQQQNALLNYNGCTVTVFQDVIQDPIVDVFEPSDAEEAISEDFRKGLDAAIPLSRDSEFIIGPETQAVLDALSGSSAINLLQPGAGASTSNLVTQLVANVSLISNYLTQGDFFNGKPSLSTKPALQTFSSKNYFQGNMSISAVQKQVDTRNILADNQPPPISNLPAMTNPALIDPGLRPAPSEEVFIAEAASSDGIEPADTALLAARFGFIYQVEYMATYMTAGVGAMVSTPVWAPLARSVWQDALAANRALVCRLKKYKTYLATFAGLKMPIYNEIFILGNPGDTLDLPPATSDGNITPYTLPTFLADNIDQYADSIEFANSYDTDTRVSTRPVPSRARATNNNARQGSTQFALQEIAITPVTSAAATIAATPAMTVTTAALPAPLTVSERSQAYSAFYRWYKKAMPNGKRRWEPGSHRPGYPVDPNSRVGWDPPRSANNDRDRGVKTLKMLWFGWRARPQRRNVINMYESTTGKIIPPRVFNVDDDGQDY
jgi:hypothetical protein